MANFTTHIAVGTVVSGALAVVTLAADVVAPENLLAVTLAGVLGSVLPDIDLKDSRPSKAMFAGLGVFFSFAVLFNFAHKYSVAEMLILWLGTLVAVRYGLHAIFHRMAIHRGVWHSILAAAFSAAATAVILYHVLGRHEGVAWLGAGFMFIGFMTHLILDEIYSVDVMDVRVKSSFGTAVKFFDKRYPQASAGMAAALVLALVATPPTTTFVNGIGSRSLWADLQSRMLPRDKWFGLYRPGSRAASVPVPTGANMETGSIPERTADEKAAVSEGSQGDAPAKGAPAGPAAAGSSAN